MMQRLGAAVMVVLCCLWAYLGAVPAALALTPEEAGSYIQGLGSKANQVLNQQGALEQKEAQVRKLLAENFDIKLIGRFVVGASWRQMNEEQQEAYLSLFEEWVLRTYSKRLGGYSGQQFQVSGVKGINADEALVTTQIQRPNAPPMEASWRVRGGQGSMKIIDIMVTGVSMVVTQRSEFASVIQRQGIDGLIETLRLQVSKFSAQPG
jgi:phospholipid transport system substrate-binding protein